MSKGSDLIVSVKHSGTRFLLERFRAPNFIHTDMEWKELLEAVDGRNVIAPLRKPEDVWMSWCKRMPNISPEARESLFFHSFYMLHALSLVVDVDFISVDKQEDSRITNWSKIGYEHNTNFAVHRIDISALYMLPIINKYYAE